MQQVKYLNCSISGCKDWLNAASFSTLHCVESGQSGSGHVPKCLSKAAIWSRLLRAAGKTAQLAAELPNTPTSLYCTSTSFTTTTSPPHHLTTTTSHQHQFYQHHQYHHTAYLQSKEEGKGSFEDDKRSTVGSKLFNTSHCLQYRATLLASHMPEFSLDRTSQAKNFRR